MSLRTSPDPTSAFKRVVKKVKRKLTQTRGKEPTRRLVVVDTWVTEYLDALQVDADEHVENQIIRQHQGATSLLMVRRYWDRAEARFRYRCRLFTGDADANIVGLVGVLRQRESENVVPSRGDEQ